MKRILRVLACMVASFMMLTGTLAYADGEAEPETVLGDLNGSGEVNVEDVLQLLYHFTFPDQYPVNQDADFTLDHALDTDDAVYLLYHTFFGAEYPLESTPVKLWIPNGFSETGTKLMAAYSRSNPTRHRAKWTLEEMNVAFAADAVTLAGEDAADLFYFMSESCQQLYRTGSLDLLPEASYDAVTTLHSADAVKSATIDGVTAAYPISTNGGYYLFYDKRIVSNQDMGSLESILNAVETAGKKFEMDLSDPRYLISFFFATGCTSEWVMDENGAYVNVIDTFNSEEGFIAAKAAADLMRSQSFVSGNSVEDLGNHAGAVVADSNAYNRAEALLGDNLGVAKMPSFTRDAVSYPLAFLDMTWLVGVHTGSDADKQETLHHIARFLSGETAQETLFDELGWTPTNVNDRALEKVLNDTRMRPVIDGVDQAVPQGAIFGGWWGVASELAADLENADTDAKIRAALEFYEEKLFGLIAELTDPSVKEAYTAIGDLDGTHFSQDFPMKETDGIWETLQAFDMEAGTEFRVRKGLGWEEAFPAENTNYVVETSGRYYIRLDPVTGAITLRDASQEEIDVPFDL